MKRNIPYGKQWINQEDIQSVTQVLRSDWITQGPTIPEFERKISGFLGVRYTVVFNSGTAALHSACFAAGIKSGDEVITSPITFIASSNCVLYQQGKPVFSDIEPDTFNIDPNEINKKITHRTKAVIPIDFAGLPCKWDEILAIAQRNNLVVIEDACHALGAKYKGKPVGTYADMTVLSFHPVKHITTGEGGAVVTNNKNFYRQLLIFRNHGMTKERQKFKYRAAGGWYYEMQVLGYNYRITDFQCALGISQLKKLNFFISRRNEIARLYHHLLSSVEELTLPLIPDENNSAWHIYCVQLDLHRLKQVNLTRKKVYDYLKYKGIGVQVHYIPVYWHPYYQQLGYRRGLCPVAEQYYERTLTLPIFPRMTDRDVRYVVTHVKNCLNKKNILR